MVRHLGQKYTLIGKKGKRVLQKRKIIDKTAMPYVSGFAKGIGKVLTSVKQVNFSISELGNTRLPGYTDSTQALGQNFKSMEPGFDFILGRQPDTMNRAASVRRQRLRRLDGGRCLARRCARRRFWF